MATVKFERGWFTAKRINAIFHAKNITTNPSGAEKRMELIDNLHALILDASKSGQDGDALMTDVVVDGSQLRAWALGRLGAWTNGDSKLSDVDRAILRESCRAFRCWGELKNRLPEIDDAGFLPDEPEFKADQESEIGDVD